MIVEASYIGQTKRQLGIRIREHNLNINKKTIPYQ